LLLSYLTWDCGRKKPAFFKGDKIMKKILTIFSILILSVMAIADVIGNDIGCYYLFSPAARTTAVGTYGSPVYDRSGFLSCVGVFQSAASSAGSACTTYVTLQHADYDTIGHLNNKTLSDTASIALRDNAARNALGAQFTQDSARQLSSISVLARKIGTIASAQKIWCRIETNNSGAPSGTLAHADAACTLSVDSVSTSFLWRKFTFARPIDIAAGTVLHVVISGDYTASSSNYIRIAADAVTSGGNFEAMATSTWADSVTYNFFGFSKHYNFQNISGGSFSSATHSAGIFSVKDVDLRSVKRYIRGKFVSVGTSGSFVSSGTLILGEALSRPVLE
jgi:hypothetical protein